MTDIIQRLPDEALYRIIGLAVGEAKFPNRRGAISLPHVGSRSSRPPAAVTLLSNGAERSEHRGRHVRELRLFNLRIGRPGSRLSEHAATVDRLLPIAPHLGGLVGLDLSTVLDQVDFASIVSSSYAPNLRRLNILVAGSPSPLAPLISRRITLSERRLFIDFEDGSVDEEQGALDLPALAFHKTG